MEVEATHQVLRCREHGSTELPASTLAGSSSVHGRKRMACRMSQGTESDPVSVGEYNNPQAMKMRIVHISDTHMKHSQFLLDIPHGDVLVHSGDFTNCHESKNKGTRESFEKDIRNINEFFSKMPHKYKIFVAGNHEVTFNSYSTFRCQIQAQLKGIIYLQDSGVRINDVLFYGSPWTTSVNMGFSTKEIAHFWKKIPQDTDVLITHMPPLNILDLAYSARKIEKQRKLSKQELARLPPTCGICGEPRHEDSKHWGCQHLRESVLEQIKPKLHLFGHVHNKNGIEMHQDTVFSNAAMDLCPHANVIDYYYIPSETSSEQPKAIASPDALSPSQGKSKTLLQTYPLTMRRATSHHGEERKEKPAHGTRATSKATSTDKHGEKCTVT